MIKCSTETASIAED